MRSSPSGRGRDSCRRRIASLVTRGVIGACGAAVARGAGDGRAEPGIRRRDADVGARGDAEAAADGESLDLGDDGLLDAADPPRALVAVALVAEPVLRGLAPRELAGVG